MPSRGTIFCVGFVVSFLVWLNYVNCNCMKKNVNNYNILLCMPSTVLMYFGCYTLFTIGTSLSNLKDYPQEFNNLQDDIKRAKQYLKSQKIIQ